MGVTPDGKIVAWDQANQPPNFGPSENGPAMILDPPTGNITRSITSRRETPSAASSPPFPTGGSPMIGGGSDSGAGATSEIQIYDAESKTFSVAGQMNFRRWYPGGTIDRDGNPIIAGGTSRGIERVDALTGASTILDTTFPTNWYPDLVRTQDGRFVIEDVGDNATQGPGRYLLNGSGLAPSPNTQTPGAPPGRPDDDRPVHDVLQRGRDLEGQHDPRRLGRYPSYTSVADSRFPHMTGQAVTLPTGDVLAVGGNSSGNDTKGTPVMTPELYSTAANTWTNMADIARRRTYHSVAALLPDGRVWSAGSSFDEVQEPNGQFFSPPTSSARTAPASSPPARPPPARPRAWPRASASRSRRTTRRTSPTPRSSASPATTHQVNAGQAFVKLNVTPAQGRSR